MIWTLLMILLIGLDQATKFLIWSDKVRFENLQIIKDFFYLTYVENTGASFGMLKDVSWSRWLFLVLTVATVIFMIWYLIKHKHTLLRLSLSLIIAGAVGNFIDRLLRGFVVDFFHFYPFGYDFAVFNVADICINIGVALLFIYLIFIYKDPEKEKKNKNSDKAEENLEDESPLQEMS